MSTFSKMNTLEQHGERAIDHVAVIAGQGPYLHLAQWGLRRLGAAYLKLPDTQRFLSKFIKC